jgi:hypothetical protein
MLPFIGKAQAHLGVSLSDIKAQYPDKVFTIEYTKVGVKHASASMDLGSFGYYFDKVTGLTNLCIQIPHNMTSLNTQVEIYNKKYVIISETSWKAYLEGGGLMKINLIYDEENKFYYFTYAY